MSLAAGSKLGVYEILGHGPLAVRFADRV